MNDLQLYSFLERLREYHGAEKVVLIFSFEDGQEVRHVAEDKSL